jgi:hypothetical protein
MAGKEDWSIEGMIEKPMPDKNVEVPKYDILTEGAPIDADTIGDESALPCPFCGGPARVFRVLWGMAWQCRCGLCGARCGQAQNTRLDAIEVWNQRMFVDTRAGGEAL